MTNLLQYNQVQCTRERRAKNISPTRIVVEIGICDFFSMGQKKVHKLKFLSHSAHTKVTRMHEYYIYVHSKYKSKTTYVQA